MSNKLSNITLSPLLIKNQENDNDDAFISVSNWNNLINTLIKMDGNIPRRQWKFDDLLVDNCERSSALHLRNDNHGGSYITNRNNFVENGKTENTGLFISAANDITIQTGNWDEQSIAKEEWRKNFGIDRVYISKEGQINLGTAHHPSNLKVTGNLEIKENIMAKSRGRLNIYPNTDATNSRSFIEMWGDHPDREGELTFGGSFIRFFVGSTDKTFGHLGLVIKENGRVGIGTFDPQQELSIIRHDEDNADVRLQNSSNQPLDVFSGTHYAGLWSHGMRSLEFATNNELRMKIAANGDVGIGTPIPKAKLHIGGDIRIEGNIADGVGNKLIRIQRFRMGSTTAAPHHDLAKAINTEYRADEWNASIAGFWGKGGDIDEHGPQNKDIIRIRMITAKKHSYAISQDKFWYIQANFRTHRANEEWEVDVLFIHKKISEIEGF